ncbi:hypothetical protein NIES37_02350 [Tolypothrix tenuis PCC 7101]|uniref:Uncharacterized protein n=1 Tax=Tolypothrix tenuis PCC 7101 TaxID=231146 RepID=A0A1Z4MS54_9CYAN|nr:hypothetical protein [Aulosira sp. FACHB-113]BAY96304.1 hypothetical protein NIES37_02350 [Tolypothrix tenuis PCC 7101]BAZ73189.1 hypothetical protein NIES50_17490 [Aulosira laxa NIES-50]
MSNELFTAVSVEEQEIVTGGAQANLFTLNGFKTAVTALATSSANINGAQSGAGFSSTTESLSVLLAQLQQP